MQTMASKDLALFCRFQGISLPALPARPAAPSLTSLAAGFVQTLDGCMPSAVSSMLRTADKLEVGPPLSPVVHARDAEPGPRPSSSCPSACLAGQGAARSPIKTHNRLALPHLPAGTHGGRAMQAFGFNEPPPERGSHQHGRLAANGGQAATPSSSSGRLSEQIGSLQGSESEVLCPLCLAPLSPTELGHGQSEHGPAPQQPGSTAGLQPRGRDPGQAPSSLAQHFERACCRSCRQQILRPMRHRRQPAEPVRPVADLLPSVLLDRLTGRDANGA